LQARTGVGPAQFSWLAGSPANLPGAEGDTRAVVKRIIQRTARSASCVRRIYPGDASPSHGVLLPGTGGMRNCRFFFNGLYSAKKYYLRAGDYCAAASTMRGACRPAPVSLVKDRECGRRSHVGMGKQEENTLGNPACRRSAGLFSAGPLVLVRRDAC